jgi:hypothetical protein
MLPSGLDPTQVRDLIVRPTLALLHLPSPRFAEHLIMGTGAHESLGFRYLKQVGGGPALGLWQMEPFTFQDLWSRIVLKTPLGREVQEFLVPGASPVSQLVWNLHFACAMCRVHYWARPFSMPELGEGEIPDTRLLGTFWKVNYNTKQGKGTIEEFVRHYNQFVKPIYRRLP